MRSAKILVLGVALGGCGTSVTVTRLRESDAVGHLRPSQVEVFASGPPARPHDDVAVLDAEQVEGGDDTRAFIGALQSRAAELGCDAIVLGGRTDHDGAPLGSAWRLVDPGRATMSATCIVYRDAREETVGSFDRPISTHRRIASNQRVDGEDPR
ncbi:MAG TPA: hypothetical protein VHJ20_23415 [Polyangia bacterium]|nr:hypothetical protein [Polyangia bacterium]